MKSQQNIIELVTRPGKSVKNTLFFSGEEEDDDSSNDRPAGMKIARMGSDGVGRAAVRSPDPSPVRRSNRARKVRQVVKEDSDEGMCNHQQSSLV